MTEQVQKAEMGWRINEWNESSLPQTIRKFFFPIDSTSNSASYTAEVRIAQGKIVAITLTYQSASGMVSKSTSLSCHEIDLLQQLISMIERR